MDRNTTITSAESLRGIYLSRIVGAPETRSMAGLLVIFIACVLSGCLSVDVAVSDSKAHADDQRANSMRIIEKSVMVPAPVSEVWADWSTVEGQSDVFGTKVILELKTNGLYEVWFLPEAEPGQRGHEDGRILGFQEERMLAFSWTMPPYMPTIRPHHTFVQLFFEQTGSSQTTIKLYHTGFGTGDDWDAGYEYFNTVWTNVLNGYATSKK